MATRRTGTAGLITETDGAMFWPSEAVFDDDHVYRYRLTRTWGDGPPLSIVMLNPSTADAFTEDATIRRCTAFARREGAGGIRVVNLFAYRATDPAGLKSAADPVGPRNDEFLLAECARGTDIIVAWGAHGKLLGRAAQVTAMLTTSGARLRCLGTTGDGSPRHPVRLAADTPLTHWAPRAGQEMAA